MKRFKCSCGQQAIAGSDRWPSVMLCYECLKILGEFFVTRMPDTLDANPLAVELLGLEQIGDRYRIWIVGDEYVSREFYFLDSKNDS